MDYTYDGTNQVLTANGDVGTDETYTYDLAGRLATRTLREIDLYLADVPARDRLDRVREHVVQALREGRADTFVLGADPVGIITHTPELDYHYTTALPTEAYFSRRFLRLSRRYNDMLVGRLGTDLRAYSRSDHADAASWFGLMGYEPAGSDGDAVVYVYSARRSAS